MNTQSLLTFAQQRGIRERRQLNTLYIALIAVGLIAPWVAYPVFLMKLLCFGLFACSFNLLLGYTGLLSFGHAAFLAAGGYSTGYLLSQHPGIGPELAIIGGTAAAALVGALFGALAIRRQGIYFAMITLALAQLLYFLFLKAPFTGGEDGLHGISRGKLLGFIDLADNHAMYYFVLAITVLGFALAKRVVHSPFGQILQAIRENEDRATSLGYNVTRYKWLAFVISSGIAGLAGSTKAVVFQLATLSDAHWHMSGEVVLMTLLGGVGTLLGPFVGAGIVISLQHLLAQSPLGTWGTPILGCIFVLCVLCFRSGVVGSIKLLVKKNFK
ncbi:branched-chain amino acid ABC transporter permease [Pseudomonas sp. WJP1]|uniref:branched-chain amino acid ABC transporter permease n=1 Tax=Pseudomonas sp. WJP1 TaxID=2986947 RepID=UPI0023497B5A|nr:branched-chain amino acid ABC transporter permease [Pseudomonas sp. WJP1]WCM48665.1 branched-chain amino acid ABC transporter permease [Pseudomonas sp. WJP1]